MLDAIQQGLVTSSTKARLEELEHTKKELEISILQEKIQKPMLTEEQVVFWIGRFKDGDIHDSKYRRDLIDIFVNAVYVYDDRIVFTFNVKDGARTVTLEDIQSSDLKECVSPESVWTHFAFRLFFCIKPERPAALSGSISCSSPQPAGCVPLRYAFVAPFGL